MQSVTINIKDNNIKNKVVWFLEHLKEDGVEIVSQEDFEDYKLLVSTRNESSVPFDDYLKHAD